MNTWKISNKTTKNSSLSPPWCLLCILNGCTFDETFFYHYALPFSCKNICGFSSLSQLVWIREEEALRAISKKETEAIAWIKLLSHWKPEACYLQARAGLILSAWNSGKLVLILVHYSSVPNMIYPCSVRFLEFVCVAVNKHSSENPGHSAWKQQSSFLT